MELVIKHYDEAWKIKFDDYTQNTAYIFRVGNRYITRVVEDEYVYAQAEFDNYDDAVEYYAEMYEDCD